MTFDFSGTGRFWNGGDVYRTVFFNSLSIMLPEGERFFIKVARQLLPSLKDDLLIKETRGFIAQEAAHSAQHMLYNNELRKMGYPVDRLEKFIRWQINFALKHLPLKWLAAMAASYEHYTALIGDGVLSNAKWLDGADNGFADLWRWHSVEEVEHKAVTFDLYQSTGGGYLLRSFVMLVVSLNFIINLLIIQFSFLKFDKKLLDLTMWKQSLKFIFADSGMLSKLLIKYLAYYRPGFNPWDDDNKTLIDDWVSKYEE